MIVKEKLKIICRHKILFYKKYFAFHQQHKQTIVEFRYKFYFIINFKKIFFLNLWQFGPTKQANFTGFLTSIYLYTWIYLSDILNVILPLSNPLFKFTFSLYDNNSIYYQKRIIILSFTWFIIWRYLIIINTSISL